MPIAFYVKSGQDYLHATLWIAERSCDRAIVFCHGWGGGTSTDDLLEMLSTKGYHVLRFHQRGYGNSTGKKDLASWPGDMGVCADALRGLAGTVWAAGLSTGGSMALIAATEQDRFAGAIAMAPFCSLARLVQDNPEARGILEGHFGALREEQFAGADVLAQAAQLKKPVLLVHGTRDESIPFEHSRLLSARLGPSAHFIQVENADHQFKNADRPRLVDQIASWLGRSR
jgi:pimeloyl-ACP methyl ester carboxylesterase